MTAPIDLGAPCNNRCLVCPRPIGEALPGAEARASVAAAGGAVLHGGEPTLRPDLDQLIAIAARGGEVQLETNGRAFALAGRAARARSAGLGAASVALLGAQARSHDALAQAPGAFRQSLAGAIALRAAGVRLAVRLVVTRSSLPELPAMAALALGLGAEAVRFSFARADGEGGPARGYLLARYESARPAIESAAAALRKAGRAVTVDGAPRCAIPDGALASPTRPACFAPGPPDDAFSPRCDGCALRDGCPGVPAGYLARFGDGELRPA